MTDRLKDRAPKDKQMQVKKQTNTGRQTDRQYQGDLRRSRHTAGEANRHIQTDRQIDM